MTERLFLMRIYRLEKNLYFEKNDKELDINNAQNGHTFLISILLDFTKDIQLAQTNSYFTSNIYNDFSRNIFAPKMLYN